MASAEGDRRSELRRRIQQLQDSLSSLQMPAGREEVETHEVTLKSVSAQVTDTERRLLGRFNSAQTYLVNQLDEQLLGTLMIVGLFILTAFYVFYFLMDNLLRLRRCRCPDVTPGDWNVLLHAARYQIAKEAADTPPTATPPTTTVASPPPVMLKTMVVDACSA